MDCDEAIAKGVVDIASIQSKKSTYSTEPQNVCLGIKQLSLSTLNPPTHLLTGVTAFVPRGGITAVMGASSAGKSLLMKFLCGRLHSMEWTGEVTYEGRTINPTAPENGFAYVPQDDLLIGDITIRETFNVAAGLRKNQSRSKRKEDVDAMISTLGLAHVGDNVIGTVLKRGLSGGQKRRVMVGQELICNSACCFLDEPTSGLDGTTAFDVVDAISRFCKLSAGAFSVMMSIHQPNIRIVNLFDNILFLGGGGSVFFGTLPEAILHFSCIGKMPPAGQNPTDFIISVTDDTFAKLDSTSSSATEALDYCVIYSTSGLCKRVLALMDEARDRASLVEFTDNGSTAGGGEVTAAGGGGGRDYASSETSFLQQYITLLHRESIVALRDPTLYYLQTALHMFYGFLIGVVFFDAPQVLDATLNYTTGSVVWLTMLNSYIQIFKIMHLMNSDRRFEQEHANGSYSSLAYWMAELTVTALSHSLFVPGQAIAYFMIGLPAQNFGFHVLVSYFVSLTAESLLALLTKFTTSVGYAVVAAQAILVMFTAFAGGIFIPENMVPNYWRWLMEIGLFTQGSRAALLGVFRYLTYECPSASVMADSSAASPTGYVCVTASYTFDCDTFDSTTSTCTTEGLTVLDISSGGISGNRWLPFIYLVILFLAFRIVSLALFQWPWVTIVQWVKRLTSGSTQKSVLTLQMEVQRLRGEMTLVLARERHAANTKVVTTEPDSASNGDGGLVGEDGECIPKPNRPHEGASDGGGGGRCCSRSPTRPAKAVGSNRALNKVTPLEEELKTASESQLENIGDASAANAENDVQEITQRSLARIEKAARQQSELHAASTPRTHTRAGPILVWEDIVLTLPKTGQVLIDHVNGHAIGGRTLALMGPSGAGKTTLLNVLSGRATYAAIQGKMLLGDRPMVSTDIYYVPQFVDLNEYMSIQESLTYMSKMKIKTDAHRAQHVMQLIGILGLSQKAYFRVGSLSGGEKKRVAIGLGMASKPAVMFLDECTTGLDSAAAYSVVKYVTKVVRQTNTVCVMTIHQPSGQVFEEMEDLMLLERGRLAYFGTRENAEVFFKSVSLFHAPSLTNLADVYMDLISAPPPADSGLDTEAGVVVESGAMQKSWKELYLASDLVVSVPKEAERGSVPLTTQVSEWNRFTLLLRHLLLYYWRTPSIYWLRLAELIITAFFIGTLYLQLNKSVADLPLISGSVFFAVWTVLFAVVAATPSFTVDRREYMQEMLNGAYDTGLCCIAQFVASLPYIVMSAFVYQCIFYWAVGLGDSIEQFVYFICITSLLLLIMEGIMLTVVEATKNDLIATTLSMVILGILFLLPGFFVQTQEMVPAIRWASYLMPTRYAFNGLLYIVFSGSTYYPGVPGDYILQEVFGQNKNEGDWSNFGIMLIYVAGFRVIHWAFVARTLRPYQKTHAH